MAETCNSIHEPNGTILSISKTQTQVGGSDLRGKDEIGDEEEEMKLSHQRKENGWPVRERTPRRSWIMNTS